MTASLYLGQLGRQHIPGHVLNSLKRFISDQHQATLRAKKAAACLLWISGTAMSEMEKVLTQFGGVFDGAAGPVRAVASRTCDLLPAVTRVANILHPELDLLDRSVKLLTRLEVGVPAGAVEIARHAGSRLTRGDYQQLIKAGLATAAAVEIAADEHLHACLGGDGEKVAAIRAAAREYHEWDISVLSPILPEYEA